MKFIYVIVILLGCQLCTTKLLAQQKDTLYVYIENDNTTLNRIAVTNNAIFVDGVLRNGVPNDWIDSMGYTGMHIFLGKFVAGKTRWGIVRRNPLLTLADFVIALNTIRQRTI